jgi:hypothetical protein
LAAKYILAALACAFLVAGGVRLAGNKGTPHPQSRTWLLIGVIFGVVAAWLWYRS